MTSISIKSTANRALLVFLLLSLNQGTHENYTPRCLLQLPKKGICITAGHVNEALDLAMKSHSAPNYKNNYVELVGHVGDVLHDTTLLLAKKHYVPTKLAAAVFPMIDTMQTNVRHICPKPFVPGSNYCYYSKYRRYDGYCMNPHHPTWNGAGTAMKRFVVPHFADGLSAPRVSYRGKELPSPRLVSNVVHHGYAVRHERYVNTVYDHWGQMLNHELTETNTPKYAGRSVECCKRKEHHDCLPIYISPKDYFYSKWQRTCQNFVRSRPAVLYGCPLGHRTVLNGNTPTIDGSAIYGWDNYRVKQLREYKHGRMKVSYPHSPNGQYLKPMLPYQLENPDDQCWRDGKNQYCFLAGDKRVQTQPGLVAMHTIMVRAHNWLADHLYRINPHWGDERLFQEARRIIAAFQQHITYNEYLPNLLNQYEMDTWDLWVSPLYTKWGWDPTWDPQISVYFSSAAFRYGHTIVPWKVDLYSASHKPIGWWPLRDVFFRTKYYSSPGVLDHVILGGLNQPSEYVDSVVNDELRNWLFAAPYAKYGDDLVATNIQRGREQAIPGWLTFWNFCNIKPNIYSWKDMYYVMPNDTVNRLRQVYEHVEDIDLFTGGISEYKPHGGLIGPTFACLISEQFSNIKRGDWYWYENAYLPSSFTPDQLRAIKQITIARLLCDHMDYAVTIPKYAFLLADYGKNPKVPCNSNIIPKFNLEPWREPAPPFYRGYK